MKFLSSELAAFFFVDREARANVRALVVYLLFLCVLVAVYAVLFHVIKLNVEGEQHSWVTGVYWTLVVMTTLGFGDITFSSDIGRVFSIVVLLSGVFFLLVMLPFLFIRLFYAPWLEARIRSTAPRRVPGGTAGHVVLTEIDPVALGLIERFQHLGIPYFVLEPDPTKAAQLVGEGVSVVTGENDARSTYELLEINAARLVLANCEDTANTNITLTVREISQDVPIAAIAEQEDSIDILELSGATTVLPLKHRLGEYLANRIDAGRPEAHVIGSIRDVQIAELPVRGTPLAGTLIRDTHLRERTGVSIIGLWERGTLRTAFPHLEIPATSVVVVAGTPAQISRFNETLPQGRQSGPVLVIGSGKVGEAAARHLASKGITVYAIDRDERALSALAGIVDQVFLGDAADRATIERAGIGRVASVLLTTNDDAANIYLAVFCRRLNPGVRIVSRITHERNVEAIHRAGADFALSYTSLGVESVIALLRGYAPVLLGEGVSFFEIEMPASLVGVRLGDTAIGSRAGLSVVALEHDGVLETRLTADTILPANGRLLMLGSLEQRQEFINVFGPPPADREAR
jgi:Trk K+ transport system NAD-binding subunit